MPGFYTANHRPPLCADSRLPLLFKLETEREKKTMRLNWTPLFSRFPPGKHQTVECVWSAVCNRLRSHLFLFWSRLRSLLCLVSLFHPAGSQVPIMPVKTVSTILSACRISVSLHTWDYLSFFPPVNVKLFLRQRDAHWQTDLDMPFQKKKKKTTRNQAFGYILVKLDFDIFWSKCEWRLHMQLSAMMLQCYVIASVLLNC